MNIDININNYDYKEILNIFNLDNGISEEDIYKIKNKCLLVESNFSADIANFYNKAYKIIECIYGLISNNIIINFKDLNKINDYVNKIKKIKNFEKYDYREIIEDFLKVNLNPIIVERQEVNDNLLTNNSNDNYNLNNNHPLVNNSNGNKYISKFTRTK